MTGRVRSGRARRRLVCGGAIALMATLLVSTSSCGLATTPATTRSTASPAGPSPTPEPTRFGPTELLPAYFEPWLPIDTRPRDGDGVALWDYGGSLGKQYYPVTIAQAALRYYNRWLLSSGRRDDDRDAFFAQIDWLVQNQTSDGRWLVYFHWGKQPIPWWSGMAEGMAISALLRAYSLTGNPSYLPVIERARDALRRPVRDKGVTQTLTVSGARIVVIQEYLPGYEQHVLNGWIFALVGLYEEALYLGDEAAAFEFYGPDRGVSAVRTLLPYYDTGSWSFYSLRSLTGPKRGPLAKPLYHRIHIEQLRFLAGITGDAVLADYAARFQRYQDARSGWPAPAAAAVPAAATAAAAATATPQDDPIGRPTVRTGDGAAAPPWGIMRELRASMSRGRTSGRRLYEAGTADG